MLNIGFRRLAGVTAKVTFSENRSQGFWLRRDVLTATVEEQGAQDACPNNMVRKHEGQERLPSALYLPLSPGLIDTLTRPFIIGFGDMARKLTSRPMDSKLSEL